MLRFLAQVAPPVDDFGSKNETPEIALFCSQRAYVPLIEDLLIIDISGNSFPETAEPPSTDGALGKTGGDSW